MAKRQGKVNWLQDDLELELGKATQESVSAIAFRIEGQTKANIIANDQVDTGFMVNSAYVVTEEKDDYAEARAAATARSNSGAMGAKIDLPAGIRALVAVGAAYAIWQEFKKSFLQKAAVDVAGNVAEGEIRAVSRKRGLT